MNVVIANNYQQLAQKMLELFIDNAQKAVEIRKCFCAAISRHTPRAFFELLGRKPQSKALPWDKIHLFWVDECCGLLDFRNNSHNLAAPTFIPKVGIPAKNVHSICSEHHNCGYVASMYEQTIRHVVKPKKNGVPRFDLIMLRMGADAHIASLFPDTYAFFDTKDLVCVIYFMDSRRTQITMSNRVLRAAFHTVVLVTGEEKATILREVLTSEPDEVRYPIHAIWPILDKVTWLIDGNAAKFLLSQCLSNKVIPKALQFIEPSNRQ